MLFGTTLGIYVSFSFKKETVYNDLLQFMMGHNFIYGLSLLVFAYFIHTTRRDYYGEHSEANLGDWELDETTLQGLVILISSPGNNSTNEECPICLEDE